MIYLSQAEINSLRAIIEGCDPQVPRQPELCPSSTWNSDVLHEFCQRAIPRAPFSSTNVVSQCDGTELEINESFCGLEICRKIPPHDPNLGNCSGCSKLAWSIFFCIAHARMNATGSGRWHSSGRPLHTGSRSHIRA